MEKRRDDKIYNGTGFLEGKTTVSKSQTYMYRQYFM